MEREADFERPLGWKKLPPNAGRADVVPCNYKGERQKIKELRESNTVSIPFLLLHLLLLDSKKVERCRKDGRGSGTLEKIDE